MQYQSFYELADELGVSIDTIRRTVKRLGLNIFRRVTPTSKGASVAHLSIEDCDRIRVRFENAALQEAIEESDLDQLPSLQRFGHFYLVQLVPEALPERVKIGFTDNLEKRLAEHRTAAPTARLIKSWPCKRSWDQAAMDAITRTGCALVMNEVYEGDVDGFVTRADTFFSNLPSQIQVSELSPHSPLLNSESDDAAISLTISSVSDTGI